MSDLIHHESETPQAPPQRPPCPTPASLLNALADFNAKADVKIVKTPYYNTTCRILGDGPTLIVSPGVASTYEGFTLFLNTLAQQFRTIIYDYLKNSPQPPCPKPLRSDGQPQHRTRLSRRHLVWFHHHTQGLGQRPSTIPKSRCPRRVRSTQILTSRKDRAKSWPILPRLCRKPATAPAHFDLQ